MPAPFKRRRYLVDMDLQGRMLLAGLLHGGLVLVALLGGIFAPVVLDLAASPTRRFEEEAIIMLYLHGRLPLIVLLCVAVVGLTSIRQSHRIAGPLVRFKRHLRQLAVGELPPLLRTRRTDMLKDEVACLNAAVAGVAARVDGLRTAQASVHAALDRLAEVDVDLDGRRREALRAAVRQVDAALAAFAAVDADGKEPDAAARPVAAVADGAMP
ncbi:MAG: hypothetical protein FJ306_02965 [Planctomycetes bacterium]|nr:hypothetical protein [Planctomycetota bacterium]